MKVAVGVTGSIAAYRSPDFVKELIARGHEVRVVLTSAASELVSARVLSTFSNQPVLGPSDAAGDLAQWADVFVVYAATADFCARYAQGLPADRLTSELLHFGGPVVVAPAMNPAMWQHPALQSNVRVLAARGARFAGPIAGVVACGESGLGHVAESGDIVDAVEAFTQQQWLSGRRLLISAGPMRCSVDPVRYVQNRSSGLMGLALARAARAAGAEVRVILGPVAADLQKAFSGFKGRVYQGPAEYEAALEAELPEADVFLSAAAVLDFEVLPQAAKIGRNTLAGSETLTLPIRAVPDFVARAVAARRPGQRIIAFAAETGTDDDIVARATSKMRAKGADAIVANPVREGVGPEFPDNRVWVIRAGHSPLSLGPSPKAHLARPILEALLK